MKRYTRILATISPLLAAIYAIPTLVLVVAMAGVIPAPGASGPPAEAVFWGLIVVAVVEFPASLVVGGRLLRSDRLAGALREGSRDAALAAAATVMRTSALATGAFGGSIALYGVVFFLVGGRPDRLFYFLALVIAHYVLVAGAMGRARRRLAALAARSQA
jgi:hypothetical protein